jgi:protein-L-isoaspartate O-methyltransferase
VSTALDPAAPWRARLVTALVEQGVLTDPAWREAFATVPREVFVPRFARRQRAENERDGRLVHYDHTSDGETAKFLAAVYSDDSLITRFNAAGRAASSSSQPSLMAVMLNRLDIQPGDTVLEIGTGTGYQAALLAHRLGGEAVTTIEVNPEIAADAERPGPGGLPPERGVRQRRRRRVPRAPFDRIIATCGVLRIPPAWITQTTPGEILANVSFGLIALTVTAEGTALGQFDTGSVGFMRLHDGPTDPTRPLRDILAVALGEGTTRRTTTRPQLDYPVLHPVIDFLVALLLPGIHYTLCCPSTHPPTCWSTQCRVPGPGHTPTVTTP